MFRLCIVLLTLVCLNACVIHVGPGSYRNPNTSEDTVFGDIQVASGQTVGSLSSVNGTIALSYGAKATHVSTVNGSIKLDEKVQVESINSVNGTIKGAQHLKVMGNVETVNGDIELGIHSDVVGDIISINGKIVLEGVKLQGDLESMNGDVEVQSSTIISGNIIIKSDKGPEDANNRLPLIILDKDVTLLGAILLERPVKLQLNNPEHETKVQHLYLK